MTLEMSEVLHDWMLNKDADKFKFSCYQNTERVVSSRCAVLLTLEKSFGSK